MNASFYTAASAFPIKIFSDDELVRSVREHRIPPAHIQHNITNKCPGKCSFCSCRHRDRGLEMSLEMFKGITSSFQKLGTKACTFTGGGDPVAHQNINEILAYTLELGIKVGLVTEGTFLGKLDKEIARNISWCRISASDERPILASYAASLVEGCEWALSYVLTENPRYSHLFDSIEFANKNNMTHIRVVTDILSEKEISIAKAKDLCAQAGIDTHLVIWQDRTTYCKGVKRCLISLMKPNITPDGHLVGCCGQQYSSIPPMLDWPRAMYMPGGAIEEIFEKQLYYDGSNCQRCYYGTYNDALNAIWDADKIKHADFK